MCSNPKHRNFIEENFEKWFYTIQHKVRGIIKMTEVPKIIRDETNKYFFIEFYEYITCYEYKSFKEENETARHVACLKEINQAYGKYNDLFLMSCYTAYGITKPHEILPLMYDVATCIRDLHDIGYRHLDLSLENVVTNGWYGMVIDFESCREMPNGNDYVSHKELKLLKLNYTPLEVLDARLQPKDREILVSLKRVDIWTYGVISFKLVFGPTAHPLKVNDSSTSWSAERIDCLRNQGFKVLVDTYFKEFNKLDWEQTQKDLWLHLMSGIFVCSNSEPMPCTDSNSMKYTYVYKNDRISAEDILKHSLFAQVIKTTRQEKDRKFSCDKKDYICNNNERQQNLYDMHSNDNDMKENIYDMYNNNSDISALWVDSASVDALQTTLPVPTVLTQEAVQYSVQGKPTTPKQLDQQSSNSYPEVTDSMVVDLDADGGCTFNLDD
jgi:serine/threonine protein kinase